MPTTEQIKQAREELDQEVLAAQCGISFDSIEVIREALEMLTPKPIEDAKYGELSLVVTKAGEHKFAQPKNFCDGQPKAAYTHYYFALTDLPKPEGDE